MIDTDTHNEDRPHGRILVWTVALALFVFALVPRVLELGALGFYADEDLSALTTTAILEGHGNVLPSGMAYRRGLPFTWLNVASARLLGQSELALRLPSAILGALTVPALFLFGRRWIGLGAGLTAALLLGVSEWHLAFSRQSRMYVPLLLFAVLATWGLWTWARTGRIAALAGGLAATGMAVLLHQLGLLLAGAALVWLAFPGAIAVSVPAILAVSGVIVAGGRVTAAWIDAPYGALPRPAAIPSVRSVDPPPEVDPLGWIGVVLAGVGVLLAIELLRRIRLASDEERGALLRRFALVALALATGLAAGLGLTYAFAVAGALFLLVLRRGIAAVLRHAWLPLAGLAALLFVHLALWASQVGVVEAIKVSAAFPYPHAHTLFTQSPAPVTLFGVTALALILFPYGEDRWGVAAAALLVFGTLAAIGLVREDGPTRYLLTAYPLLVLVAGAGLYGAARWLVDRVPGVGRWPDERRGLLAGAAAAVLVLSGLLAGHGLDEAARLTRLEHGEPVNALTHMFPFRPDHRSVGRFVRERRGPGDIVVAEDPLVQGWYAGEIDFWFRRFGDMRRFLRVHPDGAVRDIYVGSRPLGDPSTLDSIARAHERPVWLITSGETVELRHYYLSPAQHAWLDSLRRARDPEFTGADGVSEVYCLNCAPRADPD